MRRLRLGGGRFDRPRKSTEETIAEFQKEWDELENQDDSSEQEYGGEYEDEVFESDSLEEYEEISLENKLCVDEYAEEYCSDNVEEAAESVYEGPEEYDTDFIEESELYYEEAGENGFEFLQDNSEQEYYEDEEDFEEELIISSRRQKEREEKGDQILDKFILMVGIEALLIAPVTGIV